MPMPSLLKYFAFVGGALFAILTFINYVLDPSTGATQVAAQPKRTLTVQHDPGASKIERWRELNQILKTYLDVLPQLTDGESRVHTTFVQAAATTGRLASTNPNMQNVPVRTASG